jgi:restriction system protein
MDNSFAVLLCIGFPIYLFFKYARPFSNDKEAIAQIHLLTDQHLATLYLKKKQNIFEDDYGNFQVDKWLDQIVYFIDNVLKKNGLIVEYLIDDMKGQHYLLTQEIIMQKVHDYEITMLDSNSRPFIDVDSLDPIQFEHYCAEILRNVGWEVRVTKASGDQGVDIIAMRNGLKAVFQCKKYSRPIGNDAVQQVIAGQKFEDAHFAAVVTNNTYTPSARQLASIANVALLHYTDLESY